MKHYKEEYLNS